MNATVNFLEGEEFRDLDSFPGYQISNFGRVKSLRGLTERIMSPYLDRQGYLGITMHPLGVRKSIYVHQLVAIAFHGHTPCGYIWVINHLDGNKLNNHAHNIEVTTQRGNVHHGMLKRKPAIGTYFNKKSKRWVSKIMINSKMLYLGYFKEKQLAMDAYQRKLAEVA